VRMGILVAVDIIGFFDGSCPRRSLGRRVMFRLGLILITVVRIGLLVVFVLGRCLWGGFG